jgi:16S rRNA (uracil1498-N3)-methyltransferase
MNLFYCPSISGETCTLPEPESAHAVRVLRCRAGDTVYVTDGKGLFCEGIIRDDHPKSCIIELSNIEHRSIYPPANVHIAIAPTKSIDRFEWFLEKATEIGVSVITPLFTAHSERTRLKTERLEKVIVAAMKQSLKSWLPVLNEPVEFRDFIKNVQEEQKFIAYCETDASIELKSLYQPGKGAVVLVGPEGDFSPEEVELSVQNGFVPVSLGQSRLRTETAGVVACHTLVLLQSR